MHGLPFYRASALALGYALLSAPQACARENEAPPAPEVVVTGERALTELAPSPSSHEVIRAEQIATAINAVKVEDALRYAPDLLVRKRHIGDTQDPITTRTSGVGASARSLVYADGVLLSALIGNNNTNASPRWGLVAPEEVSRIDVLYGPFAAAYPGNSIGAVVNITTRMPEGFIGSVGAIAGSQTFSQYGTRRSFPTGAVSAIVGDRIGPWRLWLSETHTESAGQPLTYVVATKPSATSTSGLATVDPYTDANKLAQPVVVLGASGLEHQAIDNAKLKVSYDLPHGYVATYALGIFNQADHSGVQSYLTDAAGSVVYASALNNGGRAYTVAPSAFSNGVYHLDETHYGQSFSLRSPTSGPFSWTAIATTYDYAKDVQRGPGASLPAGLDGGTAGTINRLNGTGWATGDLNAAWKASPAQVLSFGVHADVFAFHNVRYATADWVSGGPTSQTSYAQGKTQTAAVWGQDELELGQRLKLTLGGRYERWRAYSGVNRSASPALNVAQPELDAEKLSPKAALEWRPVDGWTVSARYGRAFRFPTVTELYQTVTTGAVLSVPNPNLKPEQADSFDLSIERDFRTAGHARLSLFREVISDDLISQSAPLVAGSPALFNYVQNVDRVRTNGAEFVWEGVTLTPTLSLSGSLTYVGARVQSDAAFPAAVGKRLPQLPRLRATLVGIWRPARNWTATLAGRYAGREFANLDNSDSYANTYTGFSAFFVMDTRVRWQATPRWALALGADNLLNRRYLLFHPFAQRTVVLEAKYSLGAGG